MRALLASHGLTISVSSGAPSRRCMRTYSKHQKNSSQVAGLGHADRGGRTRLSFKSEHKPDHHDTIPEVSRHVCSAQEICR